MNYKIKKIILIPMNLIYKISPKLEISIMFYLKNGYKLNLKKPKTYNEKIQWIKFHDMNPQMINCVDKYKVRDYIRECGCEEILINLLWEGYDPDNIPFTTLPDRFVIKVTHGSGFNIICTDKSKLNKEKVKKQLRCWLKEKYIPSYGEWFYGVVRPRIIVEEYLSDKEGEVPYDYKILCFHGEPKLIQLHIDRFTNHVMKVYDLNWKEISAFKTKYSGSSELVMEEPKELRKLLEYAKVISKPFHMARVDLYLVNNKVYFSEITFTDGAGFDKITPYAFDYQLGSYIELP